MVPQRVPLGFQVLYQGYRHANLLILRVPFRAEVNFWIVCHRPPSFQNRRRPIFRSRPRSLGLLQDRRRLSSLSWPFCAHTVLGCLPHAAAMILKGRLPSSESLLGKTTHIIGGVLFFYLPNLRPPRTLSVSPAELSVSALGFDILTARRFCCVLSSRT